MPRPHGDLTTIILVGVVAIGFTIVGSGSVFAQASVTPPGTGTSGDPYQISLLGHLVWIGDNVAASSGKYYAMTADIDASQTATWNDEGTGTELLEGFKPIGTDIGTPFAGVFDGNGHTISGLVIDRPTGNDAGLFGYMGKGGCVRNLGVIDGGVTGSRWVGGLVGTNTGGTVSCCYATSAVTGVYSVGGLIGLNGDELGLHAPLSSVENCYVAGPVKGQNSVGGLIGSMLPGGMVSKCYAVGEVAGSGVSVGGLVGNCLDVSPSLAVANSYWDTHASGQTTSDGGTGKTTAEMKQQDTFVDWEFASVWEIVENASYPYLASLPPDADEDGVIDPLDTCPATILGAIVNAQGCPPAVHGDFDRDGDIDASDLAVLAACVSAPAVLYDPAALPTGCTLTPDGNGKIAADFDADGDVDQDDFGIFQRCYSGADKPADPDCGD